ncbi:hypothetical protein FIBSPDRAFT_71088 [Athelia psychrophila]|uniref:Uncharacterized protein n=1 Tax=Athelia psychrophila TaxID=1759441 RepID=A0A166TWX4_9AGAM|nr:hypothetical protein FIBSPDRAFT_71088 [Fibularhizoctonia sp. CBS 109695]
MTLTRSTTTSSARTCRPRSRMRTRNSEARSRGDSYTCSNGTQARWERKMRRGRQDWSAGARRGSWRVELYVKLYPDQPTKLPPAVWAPGLVVVPNVGLREHEMEQFEDDPLEYPPPRMSPRSARPPPPCSRRSPGADTKRRRRGSWVSGSTWARGVPAHEGREWVEGEGQRGVPAHGGCYPRETARESWLHFALC